MKLGYIIPVVFTVLLGTCGNTENQQDDELIRNCPEEKIIKRIGFLLGICFFWRIPVNSDLYIKDLWHTIQI